MDELARKKQYGRIRLAKKKLGLGEKQYRDLLATLTGTRSCREMGDRQINHTLDWLNFLNGTRVQRPASFGQYHGEYARANLVRLCYSLELIVPPGYAKSPLMVPQWQQRTCGCSAQRYEDFDEEQLWKLIEGLKAIFRHLGTRKHADLETEPLSDGRSSSAPPLFDGQKKAKVG